MAKELYKLDGKSGFSGPENAEFIANALVSRETKLHAEPSKGSDASGTSLSGTRWGQSWGKLGLRYKVSRDRLPRSLSTLQLNERSPATGRKTGDLFAKESKKGSLNWEKMGTVEIDETVLKMGNKENVLANCFAPQLSC